VTYFARLLARKTAGPATSSGAGQAVSRTSTSAHTRRDLPPKRPSAVRETMPAYFAASARSARLMSVAIVPGRSAFARIPYRPSATAQLCMSERMPAFVGV
jgi:hypothetical protein